METFVNKLIDHYGLLGLLFAGMLTYYLKKEAVFDAERKAQTDELKQLIRDAMSCQVRVTSELESLKTLIKERIEK